MQTSTCTHTHERYGSEELQNGMKERFGIVLISLLYSRIARYEAVSGVNAFAPSGCRFEYLMRDKLLVLGSRLSAIPFCCRPAVGGSSHNSQLNDPKFVSYIVDSASDELDYKLSQVGVNGTTLSGDKGRIKRC